MKVLVLSDHVHPQTFCLCVFEWKLRVGPVDNRPSPAKLHHFLRKKKEEKKKKKKMKCDT